MKRISKNVKQAIEYNREHPELSYTKIGEMFNCNRHTIAKNKDANFKYSYFLNEEYLLFTENEFNAIQEYQETNLTNEEICKRNNISKSTLSRYILILGIPKRGARTYLKFNRNAFDKIETEEDAYWLGFILAVGYLNEQRGFLNIKLGAKDEGHLKKFIKYMQGEGIEIKDDRGCNQQIVKVATFNSRQLTNNLLKWGIFQGKSGKEKPCLELESHLYPHYIRGLLDGDGCLTQGEGQYQVDLVGSRTIVTFLHDYINDNIFPLEFDYIYEHGTIWRFTCHKQDVVEACYKMFYENTTIYLDRKYKIAMECLHGRVKIEEKTGTVE